NKIVKISFNVKNTGKRAGAEVAQVYIAPISPKVGRPVKELKAYQKINLQPGKTGKITLTLVARDFAYFDVDLHDFIADAGDYEILVGSSCQDIRLKGLCTLS
ncbi:MAG: fibronectin type III-like domain-contianing protein, partial [Lachnospiraceae bacterium]|nr:fibronectin type III-like domain-contianing protein [Lachnospiraceae bacterium]